jgi:hypothetical protein
MKEQEEFQLVQAVTTFLRENAAYAKKLSDALQNDRLSQIEKNEISGLLDQGILICKDGVLQFANDPIKNIFDAFKQISEVGADNFLQGKRRVHIVKEHVIILNTVYSMDFILFMETVTKEKFWGAYPAFCQALMFIDINTEHFLKALYNIIRLSENDFLGGEIYTALSKLGKTQPSIAEKIAENVLVSQDPKLLSFVPALYEGLSHSLDADEIFERATVLANNADPEYQKIGILALALINYEGSASKEALLQKTENILSSKLDIQNTQVLPAAAQSYSQLIDIIPSARKKLSEISKTDDARTLYSISILLNKVNFETDYRWCEHILLELAKVKPQYTGILDRISFFLGNRIGDHPEMILNFFERWIMYDHNQAQDIDKFRHLFSKMMASNKPFFWTLVTKWLMDERLQFQLALAAILREFYVSGVKEILLDKPIVSGLSFDSLKILIFRILGFVINKEHLETMVYSVLELAPRSNNAQQLIINAYVQYIVYNYPGTIEFLKKKENKANDYEKKAIAKICKSWNQYIRELRKLPRLNELKASDERQIAYMKMQSKIFSKGFYENQEESLLGMFRHVDLKGGEHMFSKTKDGYSQKTKLGLIETGGELPRGEFIDPVGQARLRFFWKTMQRK